MTTAGPALDVMSATVTGGFRSSAGYRQATLSPLQDLSLEEKPPLVQTVRQPDLCALVHVVYLQKLAPGQTWGSDWSVRARGWNRHGRRGLEHLASAHGSPWVCQKLEERSADLLTTGSAPTRYCSAFENRRKYVWYDRELVNVFNNEIHHNEQSLLLLSHRLHLHFQPIQIFFYWFLAQISTEACFCIRVKNKAGNCKIK